MTGEGSPGYIFAPAAPQKMLENQPNGRFIVLMREPIDRVVSRVQHMASLRPDAGTAFHGGGVVVCVLGGGGLCSS